GAAQSGVVDDDVEPAVRPGGRVEECLHLGLVGDVAGDRGHRAAELPAELPLVLLEAARMGVADHHACAFLQEPARGRRADPRPGRGGDDGGAALQQPVPGHVRRTLDACHGPTLTYQTLVREAAFEGYRPWTSPTPPPTRPSAPRPGPGSPR